MKSLKNHIAVIIPLFVLLFSLQFSLVVKEVVSKYEQRLIQEYSIVIVSQKSIDKNVLMSKVAGIKRVEEISSKKILDRLKRDISSKNLALLKVALPKFYSVKLKKLPNEDGLKRIKRDFKKINSITKIETFAKTHTKMYKMFNFIKTISYIFSGLILVISVLLIFKQMKIWVLEHNQRMSIMSLFGAPFWMKSVFLYKLAFIDSIISSLAVSFLFWYIPKRDEFASFTKALDIELYQFDILKEAGLLLGVSVLFSLVIVTIVISKINNR